jgi:hypothetical protein
MNQSHKATKPQSCDFSLKAIKRTTNSVLNNNPQSKQAHNRNINTITITI